MKIIKSEAVYSFDVDETLIHHIKDLREIHFKHPRFLEIELKSINETYPVLINEIHRKLVKEMKRRGRYIIVWSARGNEWATQVVNQLGLSEYVDIVMTKPIGYVDDMPADSFMQRIYIRNEGE